MEKKKAPSPKMDIITDNDYDFFNDRQEDKILKCKEKAYKYK